MAGQRQKKQEPAGKAVASPTGKVKLAAAGKTSRKSNPKQKNASGMKMLREAVGKAVGKNTNKITAKLLKEMLAGTKGSAKMLFDLAEQQPPDEDSETNEPERTAAMKLADEPEWRGTLTEEDAETDSGSLERED
jgi:hypothetical protein